MGQRILHRFMAAAVALYLLGGAQATYRALRQPRVSVEASSPRCDGVVDVTVTVDTSGRGDTEVELDLLVGGGKHRLREWTVNRRRFAFWDPRPLRQVTHVPVWPACTYGAAANGSRLRVVAQTQSWWLMRRRPVTMETELWPGRS